MPQDQPTRYFDSGLSRDSGGVSYVGIEEDGNVPRSFSGRAARREELVRTSVRSWAKCGGRSFTTMIPREDGPNASVKVSKETVPTTY